MNSSQNPERVSEALDPYGSDLETPRDPYQLLDELMMVVEALCPVWPGKDSLATHRTFLL